MGGTFDVNAGLVMMRLVRLRHVSSHRSGLYPGRSDVSPLTVKTPIPTGGQPPAKQRIVAPIPPYDRTIKDLTTIAWPTNKQSGTLDSQFGPARQITGWQDCWFLAALGAMANDKDGRQILAESIKPVTVEGIHGYSVTFKGLPNDPVFISEQALAHFVDENGGDADTRLLHLAADRFFSVNGRFASLFITSLLNLGMDQDQAKECLTEFCRNNDVQDPKSYNPMRDGWIESVAFFMLAGIYPDALWVDDATTMQAIDIMAYLHRYATNDRGGSAIALGGLETPLGKNANRLVVAWDVIRTEITSNGSVNAQEQAFLNALDRWLETSDDTTWQALQSAAGNLTFQHISPAEFLTFLEDVHSAWQPSHRARLRSGVQAVLGGGLGHIGFPGGHSETIEGINEAQNTFTYSDPNFPTVVHTGELPRLIQAIANGGVFLTALKPATGKDEAESSHAGEKRGRHLLTFHRQAVNDGKIDPAEIGPLANLMAMDDGTFRHVYDRDHNGVIEGSELKAVHRRVDRWVNHLTLTPIW